MNVSMEPLDQEKNTYKTRHRNASEAHQQPLEPFAPSPPRHFWRTDARDWVLHVRVTGCYTHRGLLQDQDGGGIVAHVALRILSLEPILVPARSALRRHHRAVRAARPACSSKSNNNNNNNHTRSVLTAGAGRVLAMHAGPTTTAEMRRSFSLSTVGRDSWGSQGGMRYDSSVECMSRVVWRIP